LPPGAAARIHSPVRPAPARARAAPVAPAPLRPLHPLLRAPWALAIAAARTAARLAPAGDGKLARALRARRDLLPAIRAQAPRRDLRRPLVWLHAPSVGEGLQARPVLEALRQAHPEWQLAYSWFSPSADRFAERLEVDLRAPLPFDGRREARTLLDAWQPDVLAFVKLDVWPVLAEQAARRGVRLALVSATLAETSGRRGRLARALLGDAYAALDAVGAIAAADAARLAELGVRTDRLTVTGDTRLDQVWARTTAVGPEHAVRRLRAPDADPVLVAGSTWPADERVLLPALARWLAETPHARCIVAPHEPDRGHLEPIERWAAAAALPLARLGDVMARPSPASGWRVLLVDRVGVLGDLYALGDLAFVGGGFHDAGLHSVLEPAAFGIPVLFGPRHRNAREAGELARRGGGDVVADADATLAALRRYTHEPAARHDAGAAARALVADGLGSTARVTRLIASLVAERRRPS
jgi:3-deoxy-D-manno-octulosonic-acid transferase